MDSSSSTTTHSSPSAYSSLFHHSHPDFFHTYPKTSFKTTTEDSSKDIRHLAPTSRSLAPECRNLLNMDQNQQSLPSCHRHGTQDEEAGQASECCSLICRTSCEPARWKRWILLTLLAGADLYIPYLCLDKVAAIVHEARN